MEAALSTQETPKKGASPVKEELTEEQLDQVAGGGGQPHMIGGLLPAVQLDAAIPPFFQKAIGEQKV